MARSGDGVSVAEPRPLAGREGWTTPEMSTYIVPLLGLLIPEFHHQIYGGHAMRVRFSYMGFRIQGIQDLLRSLGSALCADAVLDAVKDGIGEIRIDEDLNSPLRLLQRAAGSPRRAHPQSSGCPAHIEIKRVLETISAF